MGDQCSTHSHMSSAQLSQVQTSAPSCDFSQQSTVLQPLDVQTNAADDDSTTPILSPTCTRTRTVKTPKPYDV